MRDRTFVAVLAAFTLTVALLFFSSWLSFRILSGVRAYVGGEGLYSKAQKNAVYFLAMYVQTGDDAWFNSFEQALRIPEGDRDARIELERANPRLPTVRNAFIQGGNSPEDVNSLIFIFRYMRWDAYVNNAVRIWTEGDPLIAHLHNLGRQIHQYRSSQSGAATVVSLMSRVEVVNQRLTLLENDFSATLGAGARSIGTELLSAMLLLSVILWLTGALLSGRLLSALARERENLRATIENAPLGIVLLDAPSGRIRMGNSHAWHLLGPNKGTYVGAEYGDRWQALSPEGRPLQWPDYPVAKALDGQVIQGQDLQWSRTDSEKIWLRVSAAPIRKRGRIVGAVTAFYDITEERKVEETLVQRSQELARSNADLEQFAYTTSHDLQAPLRNIGIYSQMLARHLAGNPDPAAEDMLTVIRSGVDRMSTLIRDLLAFSRVNNLSAGAMAGVDLNEAVEWARSNLKATIDENHALIESRLYRSFRT
jgi:PAS domain S-box-containing protein